MKRQACVLVMCGPLLLTGCGMRKAHLTERYGESFDAAFAAQRDRQDKAPATAATGLDSQEAAIVTDSYRSSLGRKGLTSSDQPVILVAPGATNRATSLAPSVPKE